MNDIVVAQKAAFICGLVACICAAVAARYMAKFRRVRKLAIDNGEIIDEQRSEISSLKRELERVKQSSTRPHRLG